MQNPMLQQLNQAPTRMSAPNNPMQMVQRFQEFRQQMAGKNPQQMVDQLVQSGQMSPEQRDGLYQQAQSMLSMFRR